MNSSERRESRKKDAAGAADSTRTRLIMAAGEAFAEHGYRGANLRAICAAARANLGAVRYYFGGKMELYRETLLDAVRGVIADEADELRRQGSDPEEDLRRWIEVFLRVVLYRRARHPYLSRLFAMELAHPTGVIDDLVGVAIGPARDGLRQIIARLTGRGPRERAVAERANMIAFLCVQFEVLRPLVNRLGPRAPESMAEVRALGRRIHAFVRAGLVADGATVP
ncbi:MAG: CerR family C-terminal domain-containing protein [Planctomycetes bacterium]|nr:CerR family C-terminal domain-containing protein [Planctomycetota bacterium]